MADSGGSQHGIARTTRVRTEEQRLRDLERIKQYRELEDEVRSRVAQNDYSPDVFHLTSKLLRLNPEYYTIWNVRRRSLISGLFSKPSAGSSCSRACSSTTRSATTTASSANSSSSSSTTTPPNPGRPTTGKSGTTADDGPSSSALTTDNDDAKPSPEKQDLALLQSELNFTIPLLLESPKCYWIWSYRLWLLREAVTRLSPALAREIWQAELGLASKMLAKDRRNFHAWGYRRHVVAQLESESLRGSSMAEAEFAYTDRMINGDLSNFSAWHGRSKLIPRLLEERGAGDAERKKFLDSELDQIHNALNVGPEDQSLWYYHQFLMLGLVNPNDTTRASIAPALTLDDRIQYVSSEIDEIKELLEDYHDMKLIYEALFDYTLYLCRLQNREPDAGEKADLVAWLGKLKELDPMRAGRWADLERECGLK